MRILILISMFIVLGACTPLQKAAIQAKKEKVIKSVEEVADDLMEGSFGIICYRASWRAEQKLMASHGIKKQDYTEFCGREQDR